MNAQSFEKLYGLRYLLLIFIVVVLFACGLFTINRGALFDLVGISTEVPNTITPSVIYATATLEVPTYTSSPLVQNTPVITATSSVQNTPVITAISPVQPTATKSPEPTQFPTMTPPNFPESVPAPGTIVIVCTGFKTGALTFKQSPSVTGEVIGYLSEGEQVTFLKRANSFYPWYKIKVNGVYGWAYGAYLCTP